MGHTFDLVITKSDNSHVHFLSVYDLGISDHRAVIFKYLIDSRPGPPRKTVHTHKLRTVDRNRLKCDLTEVMDVISEENTVDGLFDKLHANLTTILDTHAPKKCKTVIIRPNTQWYNKNICQAKVLRR